MRICEEDEVEPRDGELEELQAKIPNSVILQQFSNPSNPAIHRKTTAEEIWADTGGKVGPDLSHIGHVRTVRDLLESISFPNATIARGYEAFERWKETTEILSDPQLLAV